MSKNRFIGLIMIYMTIFFIFLIGCSSNSNTESDPVTLPKDAYSYSSDSLPKNAVIISEEEFQNRLDTGKIIKVNLETQRNQEEQARVVEAKDDRLIAQFKAANIGVSLLFLDKPSLDNTILTSLEDGNYLHTIQLNNGREKKVVTMGMKFVKHRFTEAMRTYPTYDNQLVTYRMFYENLPVEWRRSLALPNIETVTKNPNIYSAENLMQINDSISRNEFNITDIDIVDPQIPAGYISDVTQEIGYGNGSDSVDSNYSDPTCGFQADGIRNNYYWPLKYYATSVKDQAGRGTCTGFANTSAIEMHVAKKYGLWVNLSEQAHYNQMKFNWVPQANSNPNNGFVTLQNREDYGDGFDSYNGFAEMEKENWLLPFENQWQYNPSLNRKTGVGECAIQECENNSQTFQNCMSDCNTSFPNINSNEYRDCMNECRDTVTYNICKSLVCEANVSNHRYIDSCLNYNDTCSDSTHQSDLVCMDQGDIRYCAYSVPDKNPNNYGYRITSSAQLWDINDTELSFLKVILALKLGNSVVIGHPVTTAFDDAGKKNGFMDYNATDTDRGGHGLHVIGYISNKNLSNILPNAPLGSGGGYLIVKNSWGNCWGDGGYVYIPYQSIKQYTLDATVLHGVQ